MLLSLSMTVNSAVPTGYYKSLNGKSGQALKNAIYSLVRPHTVVSYSSLCYYFPSTDCRLDNKNRVWDMYSDKEYYFNGTKSVSGMNKEHAFPKSWWGGGTDTDEYPSYTDLNHLYPSDGEANMEKSAWPLGEVAVVSYNNGVTRVGTPATGQGGGATKVFEPADEYKGDFARTYFYMATVYQDYNWARTYMVNNYNVNWKTLNQWSINLLLKWARMDAVSDKEIARNDAVYRVQNNRNPFIDNPDLAEYIWGNKEGQVFNEGGGDEPGTPELITPTQGTELDFGEVALGKSINYVVYVKGHNLTNSLSVQIYLFNKDMFNLNVSSIDRAIANTDEGYPLTITYTPTEVGDHKTKLLISDGGLQGSVGVNITAKCLPEPTLNAVKALPATDFDGTKYIAHWEPSLDEIDAYLVNRTVYDENHNVIESESYEVEADKTEYEFSDFVTGQTHTYNVQTTRLGCTSPESNVITIETTGISGPEANKPLALIPGDGVVLVKCSEPLGRTRIYNMSGQLVKEIENLVSDTFIELPQGVYLLKTATSRKAVKLVIR